MLKRKINELRQVKKEHPSFFIFALSVLLVYGLQFALKVEITPLGYFALYSDASYPRETYRQILPARITTEVVPFNIYETKGQGFLMLEILPTRYDILQKSDHCNQMNHKLQRLGLHDENTCDCEELKKFRYWFLDYGHRLGIDTKEYYELADFGFRDGQLIDSKPIEHVRQP